MEMQILVSHDPLKLLDRWSQICYI